MEQEMKELYIEGVATHDDPEPCVDVREGAGEASVGAHVGQAIEPRNGQFGVPTLLVGRKATLPAALSRVVGGSRAVGEPVHAWKLHAREPGGPMFARLADHPAGRSGNAEAVRLR
jgi:hypothetical protein